MLGSSLAALWQFAARSALPYCAVNTIGMKRPAETTNCCEVLYKHSKHRDKNSSLAPRSSPESASDQRVMPFHASRANYTLYCEVYADHPLRKRLTSQCWNVLLSRAERAYRYSYDPCTNSFACKETVVVIDDEVFAKGGMRSVYKSFDLEDEVPDWVVKQWLPSMGSSQGTTHRKYFREVFVQSKTQQLVNLFNSVQSEKTCRMNDAFVIQLVERHPVALFFGERYISGKYKKMNSNDGWVSRSGDFASAFSHYSFKKSDGYCLICDIQGVETEDTAIWTDPQMHSIDGNAGGAGDLGITGITHFFEKHKCGSLCQLLSLENPNTNGKLSEVLALSAGKRDHQSKLFWIFPSSLPDTLYTLPHHFEKKEPAADLHLMSVNSSTESLEPTRPKVAFAAPAAASNLSNEVQVLAQKFGQMRRREQGKEGELSPHFRAVVPNDHLEPTNSKDSGVKLLVAPAIRNTPCSLATQFRPKTNVLKSGDQPVCKQIVSCPIQHHSSPTHSLTQMLEIDRPLPVPYRPSGDVPIFIRRNGPKIQPLPIVDGHLQNNLPLQQPDCIKAAAKAPLKALSVPGVPPVVKKSANDAVRLRCGKFWK